MAEFPALTLWTDAYLGDTRHLSQAEHGGYLLLLMTAWRSEDCSLPDDNVLLAKWAGCDRRTWARQQPIIMAFWTRGEDGRWRQKRLYAEWLYQRDLSNKRAEAGRESGRVRLLSKALKDIERGRTKQQANGEQTRTPSPSPSPIPKHSPSESVGALEKSARKRLDSVTDEIRKWAVQNAPAANVDHEFGAYKDWLAAKGVVHKDQHAGFRNWLRRAKAAPLLNGGMNGRYPTRDERERTERRAAIARAVAGRMEDS